MISQFFVLSARGDTIINRDFRQDLVKNTPEIFFRNVKLAKGDAPPIFNIEGVSFVYLKKSTGLFLVMTTRSNVAPSFITEVLTRLAKLIKDFCGTLTEEAIRKNFILIYEILDEFMDFGYPQITSTEQIKKFIVNEAVPVESAKQFINQGGIGVANIWKPNTISSQATTAPIKIKENAKNTKNEIFLDVYEKIFVTFNSTGYLINSSIEGCLQMKSYLQGNPDLKLALNDNLVIGRNANMPSAATIDDCNFHECVNTSGFDLSKVMRIKPPEGEFVAMNYRVTGEFDAPFRFFPYIEEASNYRLDFILRIKATFGKEYSGNNVTIKFNVPRNVSNVHTELPKGVQGQDAEYQSSGNSVKWVIKKFQGGTEHSLKTRISLQTSANSSNARKEIGPVNMNFEIPMFNVSGLQVKYLRIEDTTKSNNQPQRWVRYITQSSSYVCRL